MQSKTIKTTLICDLTDKERREYGISLATTLGDMQQVEAHKKAEMDNFKNRLAGIQAKVDELSGKVRNGKEWREVACSVFYGQPDKEHKQTIRLDTLEVVKTELMTEVDLQLVMPLEVLKDALDPGDRLGVAMGGALTDEFEAENEALEIAKGDAIENDWEAEENVMLPDDDGDEQDGPRIVDFTEGEIASAEIEHVLNRLPDIKHPLKIAVQIAHIAQRHGLDGLAQLYRSAQDREGYCPKLIARFQSAIANYSATDEIDESAPEGSSEY